MRRSAAAPTDAPEVTGSVTGRFDVVVAHEEAGERVDRLLAARVAGLSRSRVQALLAEGRVSSDGTTLDSASYRVKSGERLRLDVPPAREAAPRPENIPLTIVFEDADVIVVDKPAGLVVHPAPGNPDRTLVNALLHHCGASLVGIGGVRRPGIVHRLDKDTSGLLVAAKTETAHRKLVRQFAARKIERAYLALVWGVPSPAIGEIDAAIGRSRIDRKKMAVQKEGGKTAITRYQLRRTLADGAISAVECRLATGRTHQIRVHMSAIGHPLVGDPVYGARGTGRLNALAAERRAAVARFPRQALHAYKLGFHHPTWGSLMRFESELPEDFNALMKCLE